MKNLLGSESKPQKQSVYSLTSVVQFLNELIFWVSSFIESTTYNLSRTVRLKSG